MITKENKIKLSLIYFPHILNSTPSWCCCMHRCQLNLLKKTSVSRLDLYYQLSLGWTCKEEGPFFNHNKNGKVGNTGYLPHWTVYIPQSSKKGVFGRNVLSAHDMTHQHFFQENWPPSDPDLAHRWKRGFFKRKVCLFSHHKCSHLWDFTSWNTMQLGFRTGFHTICLFIKRLSQISVSPLCYMYLPLTAIKRKKTFWNETCLTTKMCFEIQRPSLKIRMVCVV